MSKQLINDPLILAQLEQVKLNMQKQTRSGDRYLNGSLDYLFTTGGKMLRPLLLLLGSRMGKVSAKKEEELINMATAIETIHLATLVHDDIIDQAKTRRGKASVQAKYGAPYAVYMGDYLLSQCFLMLTHLDLKKDLAIRLAKVVTQICVGDMKQHHKRYDISITPFEYIKIVSGKTAALISTALSSGAYYAKAKDEHVKILGRIGYEVGMTFQILDDLLDYTGDPEVVGKELQSDIIRGYYSMPVILALQSEAKYSEPLASLLKQDLTQNELQEIMKIIHASGAIEVTRNLALRYNSRAEELINRLPDGDTKSMLKELLPQLINRIL